MTRRRVGVAGLGFFVASSVIGLMFPIVAGARQAQASTGRGQSIGGKFMCMCGCNQVLTQCNHVGCTVSTSMLKQVDDAVTRGDSDDLITQNLVQEFGTKVYAEPPKSGLSLVAWMLPSIYLVLGTVVVIFVISRWRNKVHGDFAVAGANSSTSTGNPSRISAAELERARQRVARETED
jgi:cytochrome c-type biogenesis protein CcmH